MVVCFPTPGAPVLEDRRLPGSKGSLSMTPVTPHPLASSCLSWALGARGPGFTHIHKDVWPSPGCTVPAACPADGAPRTPLVSPTPLPTAASPPCSADTLTLLPALNLMLQKHTHRLHTPCCSDSGLCTGCPAQAAFPHCLLGKIRPPP